MVCTEINRLKTGKAIKYWKQCTITNAT
jgi:hypothetical protein